VSLGDDTRQKSGQPELPFAVRGEATEANRSGEMSTAAYGKASSGSDDAYLMERVVERSTLSAYPGSRRDLNSPNRPVRTRTPGGVGGTGRSTCRSLPDPLGDPSLRSG
jgi:hypothetical protein